MVSTRSAALLLPPAPRDALSLYPYIVVVVPPPHPHPHPVCASACQTNSCVGLFKRPLYVCVCGGGRKLFNYALVIGNYLSEHNRWLVDNLRGGNESYYLRMT